MKMKNLWCASLLCGCLSGCILTPPPEAKEISDPAVGEVATALVGESMLREGYGYLVERVQIMGPAMLKGSDISGMYRVESSAGDELVLAGDQYVRLNTATDRACFYGAISWLSSDCKDGLKVRFSRSSSLDYVRSYRMEQTLIYSGRIGNRIKLGYREFSNGYARDAFSNEAEYDISESKQIGYKRALIEVIEASNTQITYKVLRNF